MDPDEPGGSNRQDATIRVLACQDGSRRKSHRAAGDSALSPPIWSQAFSRFSKKRGFRTHPPCVVFSRPHWPIACRWVAVPRPSCPPQE